MEYHAVTKHPSSSNILKIPESMVRIDDLRNTYEVTENLQEDLDYYIEQANMRKQTEEDLFFEQRKSIDLLQWMSVIELIAIFALGAFQLFVLKSDLVGKKLI